MNIGIIYHTKTGTNRKFADLVASLLNNKGHVVDKIELRVVGEPKLRTDDAQIENIPDCSKYDVIIIGTPVWGFTATPVIITCLKNITGIDGKRVLSFATMGFPFKSMGGKQAISLMSKLSIEKGAKVEEGVIIPKMFHNVKQLMKDEASRIAEKF